MYHNRSRKRDETDRGEWYYEVSEMGIRMEHDGEGPLFVFTAFLRRLGGQGDDVEGKQGLYRFWRSRRADDFKYKLGDMFITKLIGPIGTEVVIDQDSREVVKEKRNDKGKG